MQAMIVRPGEAMPEIREINNSLEEYQALVGGNIETYRVIPGVVMLFNEEGRLKDLPENRVVLYSRFPVIIRGTIIVCGVRLTAEGEEFCSLEGRNLELMREMWTGSVFLAEVPEQTI